MNLASGHSVSLKQAIQTVDKQVYRFEFIEQRRKITEDNTIKFQVVTKI